MRKHKIPVLLSLILLSLLWGVSFTTIPVFAAGSSPNSIEIESVDYMVDNIHPRYWTGAYNPNEPRLYINFYIYIKNLANCINSIKKVEVYDSTDRSWTIDLKENTNDAMLYIGGGTRFFDNTLSNTGSVLSLYNYRAVITTKDNEQFSKAFTLCEPGQQGASTKKFLYNEDYRGQRDDSYVTALKWGKINSATYQNDTFAVKFTINDRRTFNAKLEFYDKNKKYLGATGWFINPYSKEILESLNTGDRIYTDGQTNNLQVKNREIAVEKFKNIKKAKFIVLVTKDGNQYADSKDPSNFNHQTFSEPFELQN